MRVALVTTFPPQHCGIATYSLALAQALRDGEQGAAVILSELGGADTDGFSAHACFVRGQDFSGELLAAVQETRPDVVHIQHSPDIFGMGRPLIRFLEGCKKLSVPTVVTVHTVYTTFSGLLERKPNARQFHQALGAVASHLIVHQDSTRDVLARHGVRKSHISVIPHGTPPLFTGDGKEIRQRYNVADGAPMLLFFGFVHVQKNVLVLLRMMPALLRQCPEAVLVIAGEIAGGRWYNRAYAGYVKHLVRKLGIESHVRFAHEFVPFEEIEAYYTAADVVLLPHLQSYHSASGVAHLALAAGKPLVCSDIPKFEDIKTYVTAEVVIPPRQPAVWADVVGRLLTDESFAGRVVEAGKQFAQTSSWSAVAQSHGRLYRSLT